MIMKRYFNSINKVAAILFLVAIAGTSCQKRLEKDFYNPDGFTDPTIEGFYAGAQQQLGIFRYSYGEFYHTFRAFNPMLGSGGFVNDGVANTFGWGHSPYGDIYGKLRPIKSLQDLYASLPENQKSDYQVYLQTSNVIKDYLFAQLADDYDDVPYTEAMMAVSGGYFPKFDKQQAIYSSLLGDLKTVSGFLKTFTLSSSAIQQNFKKFDIYFGGDINLWRVFTNSLRVRLAMRLTNTDPALAKSVIQEVIADGVYSKDRLSSVTLVDKQQDRAYEFLLNRSMQETRDLLWAPDNMLKVLRKSGQPDDPRLKVLFQPDKDGNYTPMPTEATDVSAIRASITSTDLSKTFPSMYNRSSFERNVGMLSMVLTSTEIHLLLAEAGIRWPDLGLNVASEYEAAIRQSIDIYYENNALNKDVTYSGFIAASMPAKPSATDINTFILAKTVEFTAANDVEKKGLIFDQRYVHFNMLKPYELWAEVRRLKKELGDRVNKAPSNVKLMERTIYPSSEEVNNNANFLQVKAKNNYTTPVWWSGR
jgi:hypothetical protein